MVLKLKRIEILDFKGIKSLRLDLEGKDVRVCGANASGKTTIADAFSWLLFGKDAEGDKDFPVKPKDEHGNEIHHLKTSVVGVFETDLGEVVLKRTLSEKWVRPRGALESSFSGNTETFSINSAEMKKGEYAEYVRKLIGCDDTIFALITSPTCFNSMDWKARRDILRLLVPSDMEKEILDSPEFDAVREMLAPHMYRTETLLKILRDEKKALDKELDTIPAQINALNSTIHLVTEQEENDARYSIEESRKTIETVDRLIAEAMIGGVMDPILIEREDARRAFEAAFSAYEREKLEYDRRRADIVDSIKRSGYRIEDLRSRVAEGEHNADMLDNKVDNLRKLWKSIKERTFDRSEVNDTCPTCGNPLTKEQIEEAVETLYAKFENEKFADLTKLREDAVRYKADAEKIRADIVHWKEEIEKIERGQDSAKIELDKLEKPSGTALEEARIRNEQAQAAYEGAQTRGDSAKKVEELKARREELRERIERATDVLKAVSAASETMKRIDGLEAERKRIAAQIANNEVAAETVKEYRLRCSKRLEEVVNDHFPTVYFRLTEAKINGSVEDCCDCFVRNADTGALVPWEKANGAGKINAGLEIVNVLSEHYGIEVPVIIDNAESVNKLIRTNGQQIALTVTEDKQLRMEYMEDK